MLFAGNNVFAGNPDDRLSVAGKATHAMPQTGSKAAAVLSYCCRLYYITLMQKDSKKHKHSCCGTQNC
jgi:hypothetical protein